MIGRGETHQILSLEVSTHKGNTDKLKHKHVYLYLILYHFNVVDNHGDVITLPRWQPVVPSVPEVGRLCRGIVVPRLGGIVRPVVREETIGSANSNVHDEVELDGR